MTALDFHAAALVTHYRHNHAQSYDRAWSNPRYAERIPGYDYHEHKREVNERAKRQLIRAITKHIKAGSYPDTAPIPAIDLIQAFGRLQYTDKKTEELIHGTLANFQTTPASVAPESNMYAGAVTWNPFKGCQFDCVYCVPSFQKQAKRQRQRCLQCYNYAPHYHEERLAKIPSAEIVFVCGNADISFCDYEFVHRIIARIRKHNERCPHKTYYFQSKRPEYFVPLLPHFPENVIVVTTLETNRDKGYKRISKAPPPRRRYRQFNALDYPRKVVTIEPVLDFDIDVFFEWMCNLQPEYVWLGFNSRSQSVALPEPPVEKVEEFARRLVEAGIEVRGKTLRDIGLPQPKGQRRLAPERA